MEVLTPKEVMKIIKCSLPWVYKAADTGVLPCIRIPCPGGVGKRERTMVRFKKDDVLEFLEKYYMKN